MLKSGVALARIQEIFGDRLDIYKFARANVFVEYTNNMVQKKGQPRLKVADGFKGKELDIALQLLGKASI